MAEVAKSIEDQPFDILDINMGCPVPKVVRRIGFCSFEKSGTDQKNRDCCFRRG